MSLAIFEMSCLDVGDCKEYSYYNSREKLEIVRVKSEQHYYGKDNGGCYSLVLDICGRLVAEEYFSRHLTRLVAELVVIKEKAITAS